MINVEGLAPGRAEVYRERERALMERLDGNVDAVLLIRAKLKEFDAKKDEITDPQAEIDKMFSELFATRDPEKVAAAQESEKLYREAKQEMEAWADQDDPDEMMDDDDMEAFFTANDAKMEQSSALQKESEVAFLCRFMEIKENLKDKARQVEALKSQDKAAVVAAIPDHDFDPDKVELKFEPYTVVVYVEPEHFAEAYGNNYAQGFHMSEAPFCVVKDIANKDNRSENEEHEKMHNTFDRSVQLEKNVELIRYRIDKIKRGDNVQGSQDYLEHYINFRLMNSLQGELIPEAEVIVREHAFVPKNDAQDLDSYIRSLSRKIGTAANDLYRVRRSLQEAAAQSTSGELREFYNKLEKSFATRVRRFGEQMTQAIRRAEIIGEDGKERTTALLYILKPSQYKHIETYLRYKYPNQYEAIDATAGDEGLEWVDAALSLALSSPEEK